MGSSPGKVPSPNSLPVLGGVPNRMCSRVEPGDPLWLCHICGHHEPMQSERFPGGFNEPEAKARGWTSVLVELPGSQSVLKWVCPACSSASAHAARRTLRIRPCVNCGEAYMGDRPGQCPRCAGAIAADFAVDFVTGVTRW